MAEAPSRPGRFFCHRCSAEISPRLPDYACPRCESGFIEELPDQQCTDGSTSTASTSNQSRPASRDMRHHRRFPFPSEYFRLFTPGIVAETSDRTPLPADNNNQEAENRWEQERASRQRSRLRQPRGPVLRRDGVPTLEGIIQQLVNGLIAPTAVTNMGVTPWGVIHSSPMNYAWGNNGIDVIITRLLNQFENSGPPPAESGQIKALPFTSITEEHVGAGLECPVCKEDFREDERVRQLPCNHLFHNDCIVPWLERHDTCPVCRMSLSGQNTATDSQELSGLNFSSSANLPSNENAARHL
ncbi:E3 ubiquitin-protein ligase RNF126-like isoform X1 [Brachionichthys hirsutus]|uniref:E3 ubiquitin-protein ligase RNF126-like isoform X1 n=1 Tax=Brachionichthys hirsutus TaxID=412623 RepID=UPI0036045BEE